MSRTVQIRDVDDEVYTALSERAAQAGMTVPELIRRELVRLSRRPTVQDWLARTERRPSAITTESVLDALDELRGDWPGAGG